MANRRLLVKRRKSVRNIRKITRTMQLIATARYQAALNRTLASRPYTEKLSEMIADIAAAGGEDLRHPLMQSHPDVKRSAMLIITSNRGLCGGYNSNILRSAIERIDRDAREGVETDVLMAGKKGVNYFRFLRRPIAERITGLSESPKFEEVEPIANKLMARFIRGEIATVTVAYMQFVSIGVQRPAIMQLLPLSREATLSESESAGAQSSRNVEYEFSPDPQSLLNELLPASVRVRLLQCFNEAVVSEHIARMVAMKAATDAAGEMIRNVTRQYNRARQTAITMELLDIVGGANALS